MNLFRPSGARTFGEKRAKNTNQKGAVVGKENWYKRARIPAPFIYSTRLSQHPLAFSFIFHFSLILLLSPDYFFFSFSFYTNERIALLAS
jgi:hypothetical protein